MFDQNRCMDCCEQECKDKCYRECCCHNDNDCGNNGIWLIILLIIIYCLFCNDNKGGGLFGGLF